MNFQTVKILMHKRCPTKTKEELLLEKVNSKNSGSLTSLLSPLLALATIVKLSPASLTAMACESIFRETKNRKLLVHLYLLKPSLYRHKSNMETWLKSIASKKKVMSVPEEKGEMCYFPQLVLRVAVNPFWCKKKRSDVFFENMFWRSKLITFARKPEQEKIYMTWPWFSQDYHLLLPTRQFLHLLPSQSLRSWWGL